MFRTACAVAVSITLTLTSCANPTVVEYGHTGPLACSNIASELSAAKAALADSRKEDHFKWRYLLILPAAVSVYRMHKAETAAKKRIEELEALARRQACNLNNPTIPTQPGMDSYFNSFNDNQRAIANDTPLDTLTPLSPPTPIYSAPAPAPTFNPSQLQPAYPSMQQPIQQPGYAPSYPGQPQQAIPPYNGTTPAYPNYYQQQPSSSTPWLNQPKQQPQPPASGYYQPQANPNAYPGSQPQGNYYQPQAQQNPAANGQQRQPVPQWQTPVFDSY